MPWNGANPPNSVQLAVSVHYPEWFPFFLLTFHFCCILRYLSKAATLLSRYSKWSAMSSRSRLENPLWQYGSLGWTSGSQSRLSMLMEQKMRNQDLQFIWQHGGYLPPVEGTLFVFDHLGLLYIKYMRFQILNVNFENFHVNITDECP